MASASAQLHHPWVFQGQSHKTLPLQEGSAPEAKGKGRKARPIVNVQPSDQQEEHTHVCVHTHELAPGSWWHNLESNDNQGRPQPTCKARHLSAVVASVVWVTKKRSLPTHSKWLNTNLGTSTSKSPSHLPKSTTLDNQQILPPPQHTLS